VIPAARPCDAENVHVATPSQVPDEASGRGSGCAQRDPVTGVHRDLVEQRPRRDGVQRELGRDVDWDPFGYEVAAASRNRNALGPSAGVPKRNSCPFWNRRVARVDDEAGSLEPGNLWQRRSDAVPAPDEHRVGRLHD
jgi:hypothetical protein